MNNNCLYFNLNIKNEHSTVYYAMLYQALESLTTYYDGSFDVVVYYDCYFNFDDFKYLDKYHLKNFEYIKFIESDYSKYYSIDYNLPRLHDAYICKWYNLAQLFLMKYNKVFFTDCDVLFFKDPSYIFDKYDTNKKIYGLGCFDKVFNILYPNVEPFLSGQLILDFNAVSDWSSFYNKIIELRHHQNNLAEKLYINGNISIDEKKMFQYFNEQYAPFMYLKTHNDFIYIEPEDYKVVDWRTLDGINKYFNVSIENNEIILSSIESTVLHYCSGAYSFMLKPYLLANKNENTQAEWINKIKSLL